MPNKIVLRLDMKDCSKCKKIALHSVTQIEGIDSLTIDMKESTLTVIGDADPVCMCNVMRKKFKCAQLASVGPVPKPEPPKPPKPPKPLKLKCEKCEKEFDPPKWCPECKAKCKAWCKCKPLCEGKCKEECKCKQPCQTKCKCKCKPPCETECKCKAECKEECKCKPAWEAECKEKCNPPAPACPPKPASPPSPPKPASEEKCKGKCNPPCLGCSCILVHCCPRRCACSSQQVDCYPPCYGCSSGSQILWPRYNNPGAPGEAWYVWDEERQGGCVIM